LFKSLSKKGRFSDFLRDHKSFDYIDFRWKPIKKEEKIREQTGKTEHNQKSR